MDVKVSNKETRMLPTGMAEVLVNDAFDLYPIFSEKDQNLIIDMEIMDDPDKEIIDRGMFAVVKQRGLNPLDPMDGNQWAEYLLGEVAAPVLLQQINKSVAEEGPGVRAVPEAVMNGRDSYTVFNISLTGVSQ